MQELCLLCHYTSLPWVEVFGHRREEACSVLTSDKRDELEGWEGVIWYFTTSHGRQNCHGSVVRAMHCIV